MIPMVAQSQPLPLFAIGPTFGWQYYFAETIVLPSATFFILGTVVAVSEDVQRHRDGLLHVKMSKSKRNQFRRRFVVTACMSLIIQPLCLFATC